MNTDNNNTYSMLLTLAAIALLGFSRFVGISFIQNAMRGASLAAFLGVGYLWIKKRKG